MTDASASSSSAGSAVMASVAAAHFSHATAAMARTFNGAHLTSVCFPMTLPEQGRPQPVRRTAWPRLDRADCAALAGGNLLRALRAAETFAARAQA
jgi:hypothetical protein